MRLLKRVEFTSFLPFPHEAGIGNTKWQIALRKPGTRYGKSSMPSPVVRSVPTDRWLTWRGCRNSHGWWVAFSPACRKGPDCPGIGSLIPKENYPTPILKDKESAWKKKALSSSTGGSASRLIAGILRFFLKQSLRIENLGILYSLLLFRESPFQGPEDDSRDIRNQTNKIAGIPMTAANTKNSK